MKKRWILLVAVVLLAGSGKANAEESRLRLGVSATYWTAVGHLDVNTFDKKGVGYALSLQYRPPLLGYQVDLETLPDQYGADAYSPQAYLIIGSGVYAAAGAGWVYRDGAFAHAPFYALRAGINSELLPGLYLDLFGSYRFHDRTDLKDDTRDINKNTVFLGAAVRVAL